MVAAAIQETAGKDAHLVARETTLMPNIPGFGALMALIFASKMNIMRGADKYHYISILTGLGYDENKGMALFQEHDCVIPLDVVLSKTDVVKVRPFEFNSYDVVSSSSIQPNLIFFSFYSFLGQSITLLSLLVALHGSAPTNFRKCQ